ncbi:30S ribosomal protein S13 [Natranaeroarchaeum sulfidigenes]|uniref:Small ribosomal subunit protein uS13 n=1 Tax=Natranaeroarchaeum sulfidigenes TaxID=2784880 RepID=A0A897MIF5_9EURY|nr:30S ribosomal protein S13 [Natranaeroarchaeum sulfidigenes]QSG01910.1 Ribosomal protein S13 [Natranaeroarchaeum sulfidigenes]
MSAEEPQDEIEDDEDLRYFVRIGQTDLDGTKSVERSLIEMNGIGRRTARIIADKAGVDRQATFGRLDDDEIDAVVDVVDEYAEEVPDWLTNRQRDFFSGETSHKVGNDLNMKRRHDINRMKMISSYKGVRHNRGQKVRGQRTKSTGRTEGTIGVNVEELREEAAEEAAEAEGDDE